MPDRWGASAGSISVTLQLLTNNGDTEDLFRAAFLQSGGPIPVGDITRGQSQYDALVRDTKCDVAADTLECLRQLPFSVLKAAVDQAPGPVSYQVRSFVLY